MQEEINEKMNKMAESLSKFTAESIKKTHKSHDTVIREPETIQRKEKEDHMLEEHLESPEQRLTNGAENNTNNTFDENQRRNYETLDDTGTVKEDDNFEKVTHHRR
ncbi:hypothetical protein C0J52_22185 [Blattella germanica]|nr:hypothetical protein C0J52_22185 [Blattella germanica]